MRISDWSSDVCSSDLAGLWRVRNISDHGMMLATTIAVDPGERLQVALSEQVMLTGKVVWARDGRCGVAFDAVIDAVDILRRLAAERQSGEYRPPRLLGGGPATPLMPRSEGGRRGTARCSQ